MKILIQKYFNYNCEERFQVVLQTTRRTFRGFKSYTYIETEILDDEIITYEAAQKTAVFYVNELGGRIGKKNEKL